MVKPKQRGQSGHPMPEPVMRTMLPAKTTNDAKTNVVLTQRLNRRADGSRKVRRFCKMGDLDCVDTVEPTIGNLGYHSHQLIRADLTRVVLHIREIDPPTIFKIDRGIRDS